MGFGFCHTALCGALYLAASVQAATITNRSVEYEYISVIEGNAERSVAIGPSESITICSRGCVVRLSNGEEYELFGDEEVSIEDGLMFIDDSDD